MIYIVAISLHKILRMMELPSMPKSFCGIRAVMQGGMRHTSMANLVEPIDRPCIVAAYEGNSSL